MTNADALRIVGPLADGFCPFTGEALPAEGLFQRAEVARALYVAVRALEKAAAGERTSRSLPPQAGRPWTAKEDQQLGAEFDAGKPPAELARLHGRTLGAIHSRLMRLGKIRLDAAETRSNDRFTP
jgi:hypothetical protein